MGSNVSISTGEEDLTNFNLENFCGRGFVNTISTISPYSYNYRATVWGTLSVEFEKPPIIGSHDSVKFKLKVFNNTRTPQHFHVRWITPDGWMMSGVNNLTTYKEQDRANKYGVAE
jgi:hypothetical protein